MGPFHTWGQFQVGGELGDGGSAVRFVEVWHAVSIDLNSLYFWVEGVM